MNDFAVIYVFVVVPYDHTINGIRMLTLTGHFHNVSINRGIPTKNPIQGWVKVLVSQDILVPQNILVYKNYMRKKSLSEWYLIHFYPGLISNYQI